MVNQIVNENQGRPEGKPLLVSSISIINHMVENNYEITV